MSARALLFVRMDHRLAPVCVGTLPLEELPGAAFCTPATCEAAARRYFRSGPARRALVGMPWSLVLCSSADHGRRVLAGGGQEPHPLPGYGRVLAAGGDAEIA